MQEGLFFEVKPRNEAPSLGSTKEPRPSSTSSHRSHQCFTPSPLAQPRLKVTHFGVRTAPSTGAVMEEAGVEEEEEEEVQYRLTLVGSLPVHPLTTMAMLPWVVAEIRRPRPGERERGAGARPGGPGALRRFDNGAPARNQAVCLRVSASRVQCACRPADGATWDPLTHTVLFESRPHRVTKLIHNSQEPSSFGCLVRETQHSACYVFQCQDSTKVPEIISTLRQAGKSSARNDDISTSADGAGAASEALPPPASSGVVTATTFAKKFEVLFCGRVSVADKKAPPALIDECIEKFSQSRGASSPRAGSAGGGLTGGLRRALAFQNGTAGGATTVALGNGGGTESPNSVRRPAMFKRDPSFPCLQALDENGLSPEIHPTTTSFSSCSSSSSSSSSSYSAGVAGDSHTHTAGVQPTSLQENRTMLFMVGRAQIFLVSPDTKKVSIEKSFREISFCSQGIRHVDHFGFICRETVEGGSCHFVCYVFQCTDESLVDEIMLTLKQAFSVAALQQSVRTQRQQCDSCPMQQLHRLCDRLEGLHPFKAKLELQKHLASLDNQEQASVFENTMRARPKNDQEENELVMANLRCLYEERQKTHQHTQQTERKPVCEEAAAPLGEVQQQSSSRQRLEQFKSRAKRSLTESLEGIWKGSGRSRTTRENSEESNSSGSTLNISLSHNSTGDLKCLDTSLSPSSLSPPRDAQPQGYRRRASTFSHPPTPSSSEGSPPLTHPLPLQDPMAASKPKLVRHYSVSTDTPHQSNDVAALSSPRSVCVVGDSPLLNHRHSWRQQIFLRVATPQKNPESSERGDSSSLETGRVCPAGGGGDGALGAVAEERGRKSGAELRELWRKAILQQILLLRMEKENQKLQASESDLQNRRLKLDYDEITPCLKDVTLVWERMLGTPQRAKVKFDSEVVHAAVGQGVPRQHRGEIWKLLSEQYLLRQSVPSRCPAIDTPYKELLKQLTSQQHAILIDLGRTFPTHPYFQGQLGAGQLSLYNLLKAYSLLDPEVGYCQGLSFVAGVLLLHMEEEDAFNMLKFLMYDMGLRKQYRPDMIILQIQMYQLSRLLHDYHRELYSHLEQQEIGPSLYAAPWFLTAFASHFPLGFVARVFDMLFLQGSEVIFKVALSLLGSHKPLILQHDSLESIVDFIKTTLPNLGLVQMEKTINQVCEMDLSKQLQAYEVEYHVLQDELLDTLPSLNQSQRAAQLERTNQSLRQQNLDLLEELQVCQARVCSLESHAAALSQSESCLKQKVSHLEEEKSRLQSTLTRLHDLLASLGIHTSPDGHALLTHIPPPEPGPLRGAGEAPRGALGLGKAGPGAGVPLSPLVLP
ncbi:TBC1 domain family member 1 [Aplochiton taeniatus]